MTGRHRYDLLQVAGSPVRQPDRRCPATGLDALAIGFVVSFVVAYGGVAGLMTWVRLHGFVPFAVYRIVLGIAVLWWASGMPLSRALF